MQRSYRIGKPAHPAAATRAAGIRRRKGADRHDTGRGIAVTILEVHRIGKPWIIDLQAALGGVAGDQDEVLVAGEHHLCNYRATGVELALNHPEIRPEPAREHD